MKRLYFLAFLALPCSLAAQPTITNMLDYTQGMSFKTASVDGTGTQAGPAGANQTWNFASLTPSDSTTSWVVAPSATPYAADFPTASYAVHGSDGSYQFVSKTATENQIIGVADSASGQVISYTNPILEAVRPFSFNNTANDNFWYSMPTNSGSGDVLALADAYGTIQTPAGSYSNVLRVKMIFVQQDTFFVGPVMFTSDLQAVRYAWFDGVHNTPVFTWDSTEVVTSAGNFSSMTTTWLTGESGTTTGIREPEHLAFSASLNGQRLSVSGDFGENATYYITLSSYDGRKLFHEQVRAAGTTWSSDILTDLPDGIYLVTIRDNKGRTGLVRVFKN